jgi:hypothetical protein
MAVGGYPYASHMTETLLRSLRDRVIDEGESLAGLLRKCLLLGAETGSSSLREWARLELNGYSERATVPEYRKISGAPMSMDSMSGNTWTTGQTITQRQLPVDAQKYLGEFLFLTQPVEELERLAQSQTLHFKPAGLAAAQVTWNRSIAPYQSVINLSYVLGGSIFAGILGQIRTKLVDLIADLTMATPLTELPRREEVDAAVLHRIGHVGDVYTTTVLKTSGPTAIGAGAIASSGTSVDDALQLLAAIQSAAELALPDTADLEVALAELRDSITTPHPETGEVVRRLGNLRAVADKLGIVAVSSATSAAVTAITDLAMQGAFG